MIGSYEITEENKEAYQQLCRKFLSSKSVFECKYKPWIDAIQSDAEISEEEQTIENVDMVNANSQTNPKKRKEDQNDSKATPKKRNVLQSINDSQLSDTISIDPGDLRALQKLVLTNVISSTKSDFNVQCEAKAVCEAHELVVSDETMIQVCKKSNSVNASFVALLIILPKLYNLSSNLSSAPSAALATFSSQYSAVVVAQVLQPLLQLCPKLQDQHRIVVDQLLKYCTPTQVTLMLSAMSSRESVSESDIQIFQGLCKSAPPESTSTHTAVLAFLSKASESLRSSLKLGQCLLQVVKQLGGYMQDHEALRMLVGSHGSSLKKVIETQLKKVTKKK